MKKAVLLFVLLAAGAFIGAMVERSLSGRGAPAGAASPRNDDTEALRLECDRLVKAVETQSNRADFADARYREELDTHEPLRKQIEKMIAQEVAAKAENEKRIQELQKTSKDAQDKAAVEIESFKAKLAEAEKEKGKLNADIDALRKESERIARETGDKAKGEIDALNAKLAEADKEKARLNSELEALRKELDAAKAKLAATAPQPASTNP